MNTAVDAVRAGAFDYLCKPVSKDAILRVVANAARLKAVDDERIRFMEINRGYQERLEQLVDERTGELRRTVQQLKETQTLMIRQERLSALGQMASGITHDFNNVLMPIIGFTELMIADPAVLEDREKTRHMLDMILSAGNDARKIVRRLRAVYKQTDDAIYELVDLSRIVETVISLTMPKWKEEMQARGIMIEIVTRFDPVPRIRGSSSELREAITNLIFNAVDAMPQGGVLTFGLAINPPASVSLVVSDTGIGMDTKTLQHCLEPFYTTKGGRGSGLGLPMAYGIVQRHHGDLDVESFPGVGTTIRLRFPVPDANGESGIETVKRPEPLAPMQILVVDDESRSRDLVARLLMQDGHRVTVTPGGTEALDLLLKGSFDLMITDRAMPVMSGDEVARKAHAIRAEMPIIMLTGFGDIMKDANETPPCVMRVISKPMTLGELRAAMAGVLKQG